MDMANKFGKMAANMMVNGKGIKLMALANSFMLMEIFMMDNGLTIRLTDMEHILTLMELLMLVNGLKTNNMEKGLKSGLMVLNMKGTT